MSEWSSGYETSVPYTYGYYRELSPFLLSLVVGTSSPTDAKLKYCELGCGQGFTANILAAANPDIDFYATDFNPAQIAGAQRLASAAGISNINFYDDSFAQFYARTDLPQFDFISLHGIYSWIAPEHRRTIVQFIDKRLKPGGVVYVSYNCLPGWAGPSPLRHLLRLAGKATGGTVFEQLDAGLQLVQRMKLSGARFFAGVPGIDKRIEGLLTQNRNYLAHEYLNADWNLFYHSDVANEFGDARLSFVGSAHFLDHVDAINLNSEQQTILAEIGDTVLRETFKDYMTNHQFRKDVFVRGKPSVSAIDSRETWLETRFALSTVREDVPLKIGGFLGEADLQQEVYGPILDAFSKPVSEGLSGALSLRQIVTSDTRVAELGWVRLHQAITILVGANHLQPCPPKTKSEAARKESTSRLNRVLLEKSRHSPDLQYMASPVTGGGISVDRFQQLFLLSLFGKNSDPVDFAWNALRENGQKLIREGKVLETAEENLIELRSHYATFQRRLPVLKSLGIA